MSRLLLLCAVIIELFVLVAPHPSVADLPASSTEGRMPDPELPSEDEPPPDDLVGKRVPVGQGPPSEWVESGNPTSLPLLIRYLKDPEEITQLAALAEFAGMGAKARPAASAVLGALQDPKSSIRRNAAATLIVLRVQTSAAVHTLTRELKAEEVADRVRAAALIGELVEPPPVLGTSCWGPDPPPQVRRPWLGRRSLPALMRALGDPDKMVRVQVADTLGLIGRGAKPATATLIKALNDEAAEVRAAAARALKRIDPAAAAGRGIR